MILADDFEGYTSVSQLTSKWSQVAVPGNMQIATGRTLRWGQVVADVALPSTVETGLSVHKRLSPTSNTLYCRAYMKWDAGYNVNGSNHHGICMKGGVNPMTGQPPPADGTGFFVFLLQNMPSRATMFRPGYTELYSLLAEAARPMGRPLVPDWPCYTGMATGKGDWLLYPDSVSRLQAAAELHAATRQMVLLRDDGQAQHRGPERRRSEDMD